MGGVGKASAGGGPHRTVLERAAAHFKGDDRVGGLILGGSLARGGADFYSDVDLYIVVRDEEFDSLFGERDAAAAGDPLFRFDADPVPGGSADHIVTYPGPVNADFTYYRRSELRPGRKWAGCPVLKDDDGSLAEIVAGSAGTGSETPEPETLLALDQKFWTWCWYVFGKVMRRWEEQR